MPIDRRSFVAAAASLPIAASAHATLSAQPTTTSALAAALASIRAEAERHRQATGVPGLTIGLMAPGLPPQVISLGTTDETGHRPVGPDTLFQVGSISKLMTAALVHQMIAEGRLTLASDARTLLPGVDWPTGSPITVRHLLDHVAGLPADAPVFPEDGPLWRGSEPGSHWSYSNTGYELLGLIVARAGGMSLARLLHRRLFAPLAMSRTRGAIVGADRATYAQGYEPVDSDRPYDSGDPLAPASWVDFYAGSGCVASTAADMMTLLASLGDAAAGRGGLGLSPSTGRAFAAEAVATDEAVHGKPGEMRYGNGLMHVADKGGRAYLHHTGGMVSFSSSFHLDPVTGIAAFASLPLSALAGYRPRGLTLFAVQALAIATGGGGTPPTPVDFAPSRATAADLPGRYVGPGGTIVLTADDGLSMTVGSRRGVLVPLSDDHFGPRLAGWQDYAIDVLREGGKPVALAYGGDSYVRDGATFAAPRSDPVLARYAGHYGSDVPFARSLFVHERGSKLSIGDGAMTPIGERLYRDGDNSWSPERVRFAELVEGRPMVLYLSGVRMERRDA